MTKENKFIEVFSKDGKAILSLNRPPVNVLTIEMLHEMNRAIAKIAQDQDTSVLLLRGEGKCFSAGMDVADHLPDKVEQMLGAMRQLLEWLAKLEIPTISAVHGATLGGGLEIAAFTDLTYAAEGASLGQPEIKLGVFPPLAVAYFSWLTGLKQATEICLTGRTLTAEEAMSMGLVNQVFPKEDFESKVEEIVDTLAGYSRPALMATKKALRLAAGRPIWEALSAAERTYLDDVMKTEDAIEGLSAFLEKRKPKWKHK